MTTIKSHIQAFDLGAEVTLFKLDLSMFGLADMFFTSGTTGSTSVVFDGETYAPYPIQAEGFELTGDGPMPQPTLTVANIDGIFTATVDSNDDLEGAILTRTRTYERFLDGAVDADPTAIKPPDVFILTQKTIDDGEQIQWVCSSAIDLEGVTLPARKMIRDYCNHDYRVWNGSAFVYTNATCPYNGTVYLDAQDVSTTAANDVCGKRLGSCRARFGAGAVLPTRAFPGLARVRAR